MNKLSGSEGFERRQEQRFTVLKYMYDASVEQGRDPDITDISAKDILEHLPYTSEETSAAISFLSKEGLIGTGANKVDVVSEGDIRVTLHLHYRITHKGVKEVEGALERPERGDLPL